MSKHHVSTTINGEPVEFLCEPQQTLLDALRDELGLTGSKEGCASGDCGACSVIVDGRLVCSCLMLGVEAEGTVDHHHRGHRAGRRPASGAAEVPGACGAAVRLLHARACIVAAKALLDDNPNPTETEARYWLAGNLCRCTGYDKIIRAVMDAAAEMRGEAVAMNDVGTDLRVVGTRPIRPDGVDKVTGRAQFGADIVMPGMLWGKVKRSPHAHARIVSIDTTKALKLPGVKAVVTAADFPTSRRKRRSSAKGR